MLILVVLIALGFMILERIVPDQKLPQVQGWWGRVLLLNAIFVYYGWHRVRHTSEQAGARSANLGYA